MSNETIHWKFPQWAAATGVTLLMFQVGSMCGWSSPYLPRLTDNSDDDDHLPVRAAADWSITKDEASWVVSLLNAGRFLGAFLGAGAVHYGGSRRAVLLSFLPIAASWCLIHEAHGAGHLCVSRSLGGIGFGMAFSCFPLYVGEVSLPQTRGSMVTLAFGGSAFGIFFASLVGRRLDLRPGSLAFLGPCLLGALLFLRLPDAPQYWLKRGREDEARRSIAWYRSGLEVDAEFDSVLRFVASVKSKSFAERLLRFRRPAVRKALVVVLALFAYMQLSGLNAILFYMEPIFRRGRSYVIEPSLAVALVNLAAALTILGSINLMDRCGRRLLLLVSGVGSMFSVAALGLHFQLMDWGYEAGDFQWLPVVAVFAFLVFYALGLLSVPSALLGEIFPANVKCTAACLASLTGAASAFLVTKSFQPIVDSLGMQWAFFAYAGFMFTIVPFVLFYMPETKGRTLQEIQEELMN